MVAAQKTEAVFFYDGTHGPPPSTFIRVGEARVRVGGSMRYLGLHLDSTWSFGEHFRELAPRVEGVAMALCRLLPNLGGPGGRVRRVYTAVVGSVALYGAPVWADDVMATRRLRDTLRRLQRRVAIRAARGHRTVSHAAATVLAGMPPLELVARMYRDMYRRVRGLRDNGVQITIRIRRMIKDQARQSLILEWQALLGNPNVSGKRTVEAIRPHLPEWVDRARGGITYRMTHVLTGHGCFGEYLCRIGKERIEECHHCDYPCDSAQHTLESCPAWAAERADLVAAVGADLSLPAIITAPDRWSGGRRRGEQCPPAAKSCCERRTRRGRGAAKQDDAAAAPLLRRETGACLRQLGHPQEGGGTIDPTVLPNEPVGGMTSTGRGDPAIRSPLPLPKRDGGAALGSNRSPQQHLSVGETEPSQGVAESQSHREKKGARPREGHDRKSPGVLPESQPLSGEGGGPTSGLGGPGLERETRAPTPPPRKHRGGCGVEVMSLCATTRVGAAAYMRRRGRAPTQHHIYVRSSGGGRTPGRDRIARPVRPQSPE